MNEEIDEGEFYHQDFTTASEWEIFVARLEEIIHQWKVEQTKDDTVDEQTHRWSHKQENVHFVDVEFTLTLLKHVDNNCNDDDDDNNDDDDDDSPQAKTPIDSTYDFDESNVDDDRSPHLVLAKWYGLKEYIVLSPAHGGSITNESQIKVLLSSVSVAVSNTSCETPTFVQIRDRWQRCYVGAYEGRDVRTNFEMIHLRKGPQHCKYLTGLLDVFKTKIVSPIALDPIDVSVQFTYRLTNWGSSTWRQEIPDIYSDTFDTAGLCVLPIGVSFDPVSQLDLMATWSRLPDHLVVDSENYSDFDPMQAPKWTVRVKMAERPVCLLSECLTEFVHIAGNNSTVMDVLGDYAGSSSSTSSDVNNPLDVLTESRVPSISNVLKRASRGSIGGKSAKAAIAPLSEELLVPMLYFLFPDAQVDAAHPYASHGGFKETVTDFSFVADKSELDFDAQCKGLKTCGKDSLVWRLAVVLAQSLHTLGGVRAFAHLWFEFSQEMRYRWEKSISIPGLAPGFPDPRTCLLHQKLQMLNCCIDRKRARETALTTSSASETFEEAHSSTDDEEFYDCSPDKPDDDNSNRKKVKHSLWNQPVGRLSKYGNLKLLNTGEQLYIPITQEPVPKTEDQLEEDTDVLMKLGTDAAGSELRAKMMSASLLSDMESFKAANPGSSLKDFIRWYSPRDWIEDDDGEDEWGQRKGHLSARMMLSDNTWVQMWESGKPVPANRQKRLFDDTREAEKVLHYLDSRTLSQVAELMLAVLSHAVICRLMEETEQTTREIPDAAATLRHAIKTVQRFSRDVRTPSSRRFDAFVQEVASLELTASQVNSLLYKFNPSGESDANVSDFVKDLVLGEEVEAEGGVLGKVGARLLFMFTEAQKTANMITNEPGVGDGWSSPGTTLFPQAEKREFVMRVATPRPVAYSARTPQLLRAIFSKNEFRLAGAFTEDVVFF